MKKLASKMKGALRTDMVGRIPIFLKIEKIKIYIINLTYFINIIDKNEGIGR